ncbi:MAG: PfkB family carbohydrate kinase [Erysipelotrichaceae bacterium]
MTEREQQILEWIKENPLITQQEIAQKANITRSSAGVHISNLMKKGRIRGKGYIVESQDYVCVVGAANVDIIAASNNEIRPADSNPGKVTTSFGGVGRNIAENLVRLSLATELISVIGDDLYASQLLTHSREVGISLHHALHRKHASTSTYVCIADHSGEMQVAISDMDGYDAITPDYLQSKLDVMNKACCVVMDTNISQAAIEYLLSHVEVPVFVDPVSCTKAQKLIQYLDKIHTLKPNVLEARVLVGEDLEPQALVKRLLELGVKQVFLSSGEQGVWYGDQNEIGHFVHKEAAIVNTTGCGDAFMAGVVYAFKKQASLALQASYGNAAASITLKSHGAISEEMKEERLEAIVKGN